MIANAFRRNGCRLLFLGFWLSVPLCASGAPTAPAISDVDEPPAPFKPAKQRTEAQQDHLDALAHYAAGRVAQQREDNEAALREYQRAARLDDQATSVLREIVPLAFSLGRPAVAVRYALLAVEQEPTDPAMMRRLAAFITDEGEQAQALRVYEKARELALAKGEKPNAASIFTDMEMGRLYYLARQPEKAAERFAEVMRALEKPAEFGLDESMRKAMLGDSDVTYQLFGEAFLEAGKYDLALTAYDKAASIKPDAPQLALNLARVEFKRGNINASAEKLKEFFNSKRSDQGVIPYRLLSEVLAAQGKSAELIGELELLAKADEKNIPVRYFLGEKYLEADQPDKAESGFRDAIKLAQGKPLIEAIQGLVSIYAKRGDVEKLLTTIGDLVESTGSFELLGDSGRKLAADGALIDRLLEHADGRLNADAASLRFGDRFAVAELALAAQKYDEADKWFDRACEVKPTTAAEPMLAWGLELFLADRFASASKVFRRVIDDKLLPAGNPAAHYYLAGALEMESKTDEAVAVAREAAAMQPDSPRFASRIAWILYHARRYDDAAQEYRKLLEKFDSKHDSTETRDTMRDARLVLSNIAVQRNNMPEAEEWLEQVLDEYPLDIGAFNDLGYLYAEQNKRPERALRMTQKAVEAEPKNAAYRDSLGWALYRLGRFADAVSELRQAVALEEDPDGVLFEHLGDALTGAGDKPGADEAYGKALAAFEKAKETSKADALRARIKQ